MEMEQVIEQLKKSANQEECLRSAYNILIKKYRGERLKTILKIHELTYRDVNKLWSKKGFLHCTNINKILIALLVKSGLFRIEEIKSKWTIVNGMPHQYLRVRVADKQIDVDVWAHIFGIPFGKHASGIV